MNKCLSLPVVLFLGAMPLFAQQGNYSSWQAYKTISINTTPSGADIATPQLHYPTLVRLGVADSDVFISGKAGGADIRFAKLDGTPLQYQIDQWNATGRTAAIWVLLDTVKPNDTTTFKMYWGNAAAIDESNSGAVFDTANGFAGVYHLTNFSDATNNGFNGTSDGTTDTAGVIGRAGLFDGVAGDSISIPGLMGKPAALTLSAWEQSTYFPPNGNPSGGDILTIGDDAAMRADSASLLCFYYNGSLWNHLYGTDVFNQGWVYVSFTCDPSNSSQIAYVNGVVAGTDFLSDPIAYARGTNTYIGHHGNGQATYNYGGLIDEPRVESVVRSAEWIKLNFFTQEIGATVVKVGVTHPTSAVKSSYSERPDVAAFEAELMGQGIRFRVPANVNRGFITLLDLAGRRLATIPVGNCVREALWQDKLIPGAYVARLEIVEANGRAMKTVEQRVLYYP